MAVWDYENLKQNFCVNLFLQNILLDLQVLESDLNVLQASGEKISSQSDPDEEKAIQTTLRMLRDRFQTVEAEAKDRQKQLQVITSYGSGVRDMFIYR